MTNGSDIEIKHESQVASLNGKIETLSHFVSVANRNNQKLRDQLAALDGNAKIEGWIIVDKTTRALDWDGELHPTKRAASASLTNDAKHHDADWKPFDLYELLPVVRGI